MINRVVLFFFIGTVLLLLILLEMLRREVVYQNSIDKINERLMIGLS